MKHIRIASRGSKLALRQTYLVQKLIEKISPATKCSIVKITTKGDIDKSDFLYKTESTGFFTSEVENALLNDKADLAVHSLKDLPTLQREGLIVAAIPKRECPSDVLVAREKVSSIRDLPSGAIIGTSSLRRIAQLKLIRGDLECTPLRGNVETRIKKVKEGKVDAIVIAYAGLKRLGLADQISAILPTKDFLPAPAQGALAIQIRAKDEELLELLVQIDDKNSRLTVETERCVLEAIHGGCSIPLGVYSEIQDNIITTDAILCDLEGKNYIRQSITTHLNEAKAGAKKIAQQLLENGGNEILMKIRNAGKIKD